jgi:hypothetical protein
MTESRDEWIKKRAYSLWEEEGYPTGRHHTHWEQATKERNVMEKTSPNGLEVKSKTKRAAAPKTSAIKAPASSGAKTAAPKTSAAKTPASTASQGAASTGNGAAPIVAAAAAKRTTKKTASIKA